MHQVSLSLLGSNCWMMDSSSQDQMRYENTGEPAETLKLLE